MSGRYLTDMADVVRSVGLQVVELSGWQTRARSSGGYADGGPWCIMLHHTASNGDGASDADYCTFRSSDRPVCNLVLGRDAVVYVCAAGATNTNGKGGPWTLPNGRTIAQDTMNTRAIGIEMSNNGVGMAYPQVMVDAMFSLIGVLAGAYLGGDVSSLCQHVNWAPGRKIDPATGAAVQGPWRPSTTNSSGSWRLDDVQAEALQRVLAPPTPEPEPTPEPVPEEDDPMYLALLSDGVWLVVGSAVRPVSAEELGEPLGHLARYTPDPASYWHQWLKASSDEYTRRIGMA